MSVEEVISALVILDALSRRPGRSREAVSCNRRIMARLVELCCVAPRKDILITSLSVKIPTTSYSFACHALNTQVVIRFLLTVVSYSRVLKTWLLIVCHPSSVQMFERVCATNIRLLPSTALPRCLVCDSFRMHTFTYSSDVGASVCIL